VNQPTPGDSENFEEEIIYDEEERKKTGICCFWYTIYTILRFFKILKIIIKSEIDCIIYKFDFQI